MAIAGIALSPRADDKPIESTGNPAASIAAAVARILPPAHEMRAYPRVPCNGF
jgi:hypothetical protein